MEEYIKVKHSYNAGDAIVLMCGLKQLWKDTGKKIQLFQRLDLPAFFYDGQVNSTTDANGQSVCMNQNMYSMIRPLIESQEYISSFDIWEGQDVDLTMDITRDSRSIPMPNSPLSVWNEALFPQFSTDLSVAWLKVENQSEKKGYYKDKIIINRSQRYNNPYVTFYFLKEHEDKILFSGTEAEHSFFCTQWGLKLEKITVDNFYQLAQIISWCKFGIYNQSMHFHISDALKKPRILELCGQFANTFVTGANGMQFYHESALQYHFHKLLNK